MLTDKPLLQLPENDDNAKHLASAQARLAELQDAHAELEEEKLARWSQCAQIRAESLQNDALRGPPTRSDRRMRQLLDQRGQRRAELQVEIEAHDNMLQSHDETRPELQQQADAAQQRLAAAQAGLSRKLALEPQYQQLVDRQTRIQDTLSRLDSRLEYAVTERDRKTDSYMNDPLFRHLRKRGYGTRDYRQKGLAYRMDRWVAAVCHYEQALRDYELLQDMPRWLQEVIDDTQAKADACDAELACYRDRQPESQHLRRLEQEACDARTALDENRHSAAAAEAAQQDCRDELHAIEQGADDDTLAIRDIYRDLFAGQPVAALMRLAEQTATGLDQAAVRRIGQIQHRQARIDGRIEQLQETIAMLGDAGRRE